MADILEQLLEGEEIPCFAQIACEFEKSSLSDIPGAVRNAARQAQLAERIKPGQKIAITAGSREITNISKILAQIAGIVKEAGAFPYIVAAMGSHGGATAEGQRAILEGYGITEESTGARIVSDMSVEYVGETGNSLPVYIDAFAAKCDGIVLVGRVKPHTDFRGKVESGLCKMIAIGLGKQHGAAICHKRGFEEMAENVYEIARTALAKAPILCGIAILEDAYHQTCEITGVPAEKILEEEPLLLRRATELLAKIPFDKIDILIVDEIGKNISGAGMDPNVTGRSPRLGVARPYAERIVVRDISEGSHGGATGIGNADAITERAFRKFNFETTYSNGITSCDSESIKIPAVMKNDRLAIQFALRVCMKIRGRSPEIVWIKNTSDLFRMWVTKPLLEKGGSGKFTQVTGLCRPEFDEDGNFFGMKPLDGQESLCGKE